MTKAGTFIASPPPPANESADDFALELAARQALSDFWADRKEPSPPNADLDRLVEIRRAGFLSELVVVAYARPGWTIPGPAVSALRLDEFRKRYQNTRAPGTHAALRPSSGKLHPDIPGADFPDPASLPYGAQSCGAALPERRAAWQRWASIEPRLGAAPLAAASSPDFLKELMALKRDPERAARGVTWVSDRVFYLAMLDGFCAVEAHDWPRAIAALTRAVSLAPTHPNARLELATALTSVGQNKEALKLADDVIAMADDACTAARGWRRRGYILVELDALPAARAAYERSLEIDPGNHIALNELKTIAAALKKGKSVKEIPELSTPGEPRLWTTTCHPVGQLN